MLSKTIVSSLVLLSSTFNLLYLKPTIAVDPPATTYQPGFWQPVARVDLNRPITINLINETDLVVDYAVTNIKMEPIAIPAQEMVTLDNIKPSIYIVVYPDSSDPDTSTIYLKYKVQVTDENIVEVKIITTEEGSQSNRSFNLQDTGAIYLY